MLIGYARVSTDEQNLDPQLSALQQAGCEQIYTDKVSGTKATRPGLTDALSHLRSGDKLVFHIFGALAEFEREIIRERTQAGLSAARARGKSGGRPKALTEKQVAMLRQLAADRNRSVNEICKTLGISRRTFYRYVDGGQE